MQKYRVKAIVMVALVLGFVNGALLFGLAAGFIDISLRKAAASEREAWPRGIGRHEFSDGVRCITYFSSIHCDWPKAK